MFGSKRWTPLLVLALAFIWSCGNDTDTVDPGSSELGVGSLTGTVRGNGALLENATVQTIPPTISTQTNAVGQYTLNGLSPQSFLVSVSAAGYTSAAKPASIIAGRTLNLDFSLTPSAALGRLIGTVTDGDIPLERVSISTVPATFSVVTTASGTYDFTNVALGTYRITASRIGFWPSTIYVQSEAGKTTVGNMGLGRRDDVVITGIIRDVAGNPIANSVVTLFWDDKARSKTTGSDGAFRFDRTDTRDLKLETNFFVITASATNYYSGSRSFEAFGGLEVDGSIILNLSSVIPPVPGAIAGTIWDEDYFTVSGATVTLDAASPTPSTTTTQADGRYYFASVSAGSHTISVSHPSYVADALPVDVGTNVTADASFNLKRNP